MLTERDRAIVLARDQGLTLAEIAAHYGISHQRVSAINAQATEFVNQVELDPRPLDVRRRGP